MDAATSVASLDDTGATVARAVTDCYTARRAYAEYLIRTLHHIIFYILILHVHILLAVFIKDNLPKQHDEWQPYVRPWQQ